MKLQILLTISIAIFAICTTSCATSNATSSASSAKDAFSTPKDALKYEIKQAKSNDDTLLLQELTQRQDAQMTETIFSGNEVIISSNKSWKFAPSFIFDSTPESCFTQVLDAIYRKDKEAFCANAIDSCKERFDKDIVILSNAYVQDVSEHIWYKKYNFINNEDVSTVFYTTIVDGVQFSFIKSDQGWKFYDWSYEL